MVTALGSDLTGAPLAGDPHPHLLAALWRWADREPTRPLVATREGDRFVDRTAEQARDDVRGLAAGLIARGVAPQDRVALLCPTSLDWMYGDHAILAAGAVSVPIYDTSSPEQVERILENSGSRLVLVATAEQAERVERAAAGLDPPPEVLTFEDGAMDRLRDEGRGHLDEVEARVGAITGDDLATLIYSSGTTGDPKGCELTHANLCTNVLQTAEQVPELFGPGARTLIFLPLAHALARMQLHASIEHGAVTGFATSIEQLAEELAMFRPTFIVAVPRVFEKVHHAASLKAAEGGKQRVFDRAADVAMRWADARRRGEPTAWLRVQHAVFDRLVYARLREAFGGQLTHAICGGAALDPDLARFFDGVGVTVLQGYGLTETSPVVSGGPVDRVDHRSVGHVYPGTTVRFDDDGEILVKGPQVFRGYWRDPDATAATFDDGWLRTGDLGTATEDGALVITGRKKDIIVTAGGKNVVPGPLEDRIRTHPLVDQCVVVGDGRPFVGALVFLDGAELERRSGGAATDVDEAQLRPELDAAIADVNRSVSRGETIRSYRVLSEPLSIDTGELTPTQKVRRSVVEDRFRDEIEALYR